MNTHHIAMLKELDAHVTPHSRRTLFDHLQGTYRLLGQWDNDPVICVAGLFHSIYGTYIFEKQSADLRMRERISDVIGVESERLVHLFCVTDRRTFYEFPFDAQYRLRDTTNNQLILQEVILKLHKHKLMLILKRILISQRLTSQCVQSQSLLKHVS